MEYRKLGKTDLRLSKLGVGGAAFSNIYGEFDEDEVINVLHRALDAGINYIDTSAFYGLGTSQTIIGKALRGIDRSRYLISTKACRYSTTEFEFSAERVLRSCDASLETLGLTYLDIFIAHDVEFSRDPVVIATETLPALQKLKDDGKTRYIGISGYPLVFLKKVIEITHVKLDMIITYGRYNLHDNELKRYFKYFAEKGIGIVNGSAMSQGSLTNAGPPGWKRGLTSEHFGATCRAAADLCKARSVELGNVALAYCLDETSIASNLLSMLNIEQLEGALRVATGGLNDDEVRAKAEVMDIFKPVGDMNWLEGNMNDVLEANYRHK